MNLLKTSALSFVATVFKIIAGFVLNKAAAFYIGPSGLAIIGQFQNFSSIALTLSQGAINTGVTKYTAEYGKDVNKLSVLFTTASTICIISTMFVGISMIMFSNPLSATILKTEEYNFIFTLFGVTIILYVFNALLLSILNGLKEIRIWVSVNITQSIYSLIFTTLLIVYWGLNGVLIAMVTNQSVIFLIVVWRLRSHPIIRFKSFTTKFSSTEFKKLAKYASMAIVSSVLTPTTNLIIRNYIGSELGWDNAGYWQSIWFISTTYLTVVTTTLGVYYLPRLSEISNKSELKKEILSGFKIILPIVLIASFTIYVLRDVIIMLLFTPDFSAVRDLFFWQLIGDVVKISSWLFGYLMIAKAMTKLFIVSEILFNVSFVLLTFYFVSSHSIVGVTYAYALNYFFHLVFVTLSLRKTWAG